MSEAASLSQTTDLNLSKEDIFPWMGAVGEINKGECLTKQNNVVSSHAGKFLDFHK